MTYLLCDSTQASLPVGVFDDLNQVACFLKRSRAGLDITIHRWREFNRSQVSLDRPITAECPVRDCDFNLYYLVILT